MSKKSHYIEVLEATALATTLQYELPWVFDIRRHITIKAVQLFINSAGQVNAYGGRAVANLRRNSDNHTNLFATMLSASEAAESEVGKEPELLSDRSIRSKASNFIIAGAYTTSNIPRYMIWCILSRSSLKSRLLDELKVLEDTFDDTALEKLPLLNAVIEEILGVFVPCLQFIASRSTCWHNSG